MMHFKHFFTGIFGILLIIHPGIISYIFLKTYLAESIIMGFLGILIECLIGAIVCAICELGKRMLE